MNRRSWLSALGVSAAGSLAGFSAVTNSQAGQRPRVLSLESFRVSHPEQMPHLHSYLEQTFLPLLDQVHRGPKMFLEAIVAPHTPQVLFLSEFPSFDEMIETRGKIAAHPVIQRAWAYLDSAGVALDPAPSQILIATEGSLEFHPRPARRESGVFELRSYRVPGWCDRPPAAAGAAFRRCAIHPIVNASSAPGEHLPRFTYLIPFSSLAVRQEAWTRLDTDPDWIGLQRESSVRFGSEAKVTSASIYNLAPYSPLA
jgi:hypothetical protein